MKQPTKIRLAYGILIFIAFLFYILICWVLPYELHTPDSRFSPETMIIVFHGIGVFIGAMSWALNEIT